MDAKTRDFLKKVDYLIDKGIVKNAQQVIDDLEWNKSVMSSVRNGNLPVPQHIYTKFKEVYASALEGGDASGNNKSSVDAKDKIITLLEKQIALLEDQNNRKDLIIEEDRLLIAKLRQYIDSIVVEIQRQQTELQAQTVLNRGYGKAILLVLEDVLHNQEPKKPRERIRSDVDTRLAEALAGAS